MFCCSKIFTNLFWNLPSSVQINHFAFCQNGNEMVLICTLCRADNDETNRPKCQPSTKQLWNALRECPSNEQMNALRPLRFKTEFVIASLLTLTFLKTLSTNVNDNDQTNQQIHVRLVNAVVFLNKLSLPYYVTVNSERFFCGN